jgi:hypothetical protein
MMKRLMSKKANLFGKQIPVFVIALIAVIGLASATAYVVNSLTLTVGVAEPFTVQYAVIGDGGNWNGESCACIDALSCTSTGKQPTWFYSDSTSLPTGNLYAGEGRAVCVKMTNKAEASIPYVITSTVTNDDGNQNCAKAFGLPKTLNGNAAASIATVDGVGIVVNGNATLVSGCNVVISVGRGS